MEPQDIFCYGNKKEKECREGITCLGIITVILAVSFIGVLGLILGAQFAETLIAAQAAIIVLAVILGLFFILSIIVMVCNNSKKKEKRRIFCKNMCE